MVNPLAELMIEPLTKMNKQTALKLERHIAVKSNAGLQTAVKKVSLYRVERVSAVNLNECLLLSGERKHLLGY